MEKGESMEADANVGSVRSVRRGKRRIALLIAALVVGSVGIGALLRIGRPERKELLGKAHAPTGERWRMTVAADWAVANRWKDDKEETVEFYSFTAPPASPVRHWIDEHLLHRSVGEPQVLYLMSYPIDAMPGYFRLQEDYPEPAINPGRQIRTHRHFQLDSCFATLIESGPAPGETLDQELVMVHAKDPEALYILGGSLRLSGTDPAYQEMQAILRSFHIEKGGAAVGRESRKPGMPTPPLPGKRSGAEAGHF